MPLRQSPPRMNALKLNRSIALFLAFGAVVRGAEASSSAIPAAGIIPAPARCERGAGAFEVNAQTRLLCGQAAETEAARCLQAGWKTRTGLEIPILPPNQGAVPAIRFELLPPGTCAPEGYELDISCSVVALRASSAAGFFYGVQSLLQLADVAGVTPGQPLKLPALRLEVLTSVPLVSPNCSIVPLADLGAISEAQTLTLTRNTECVSLR
jgi:hypothetical protein